jgi:TatD DNase family protein
MTWVDTHAHLTDPRFREDLEGVLERATAAGVDAVLSLATTLEDCEATLKIAERFPRVYAAVGVHPNHAAEAPADVAGPLAEFARHPKVVAIGETGMDYHCLPSRTTGGTEAGDAAQKARQRDLFVQHLELAVRLGKAVVIHERECAENLLALLETYRGRLRGVFHCFGGPPEVAQRVLDLGFHVSLTGMLTFKRLGALRELVAQLPPDRVMVETDSPYMAPEPHRGKRCEPAWVVEVAKALAAAAGKPLETVSRETTETARRLFGIGL